ncbi:tetratricopeptide repeat protein [Prevotella copri]|jgi:clan AA aspartic protease (TIGR02281 family)|uniref:Tetratricopeptide repeat protein n=1 Tax=Segatella copri TaxID=165179 RepID=A0AAW4YEW3_9BACT|nr:tetratricopeptide repeat protein [Segatella copri]MCE4121415.1 tetratricopeptide repeat protein [Segatella copri]MCP9497510.1 tetratricopeptide repeat protein [Segatella copri]MCP9512721.1 tetratricopeptide repeat protein [Segatella copri]MCP9521704.1 tetratricopeptide repeat protein [Segatella copri]
MRQFILSILVLCSSVMLADNIKRPDSYNYSRGVEAINNNNAEEALDYLNKEINEHPDNGYAFAWIALVRNYNEEFGRALTAANVAVKKIPSKDKEYKAFAYGTRAQVYLNLEDTIQALKDYSQAINIVPDDDRFYNQRAQVYYEQGKYDLADKDYLKMISLKEGDVMGYMGIGRNANAQKRYEDAIKQFDYVVKLEPNYSSAYSFRAESYIGLKKYNEAIDDVISALGIDRDRKAFYELQELADSAFEQTVAKLKVQKIKEPNEQSWDYDLGIVYERAAKYNKAIAYYKESLEKESNIITASRISSCYDDLGDYDKALEYCNQAIALDSVKANYLYEKANILDNAGRTQEAIKTMSDYIANTPDEPAGYYQRGWFKDHSGDIEGALEDYTMAITLQPNVAYAYLNRGVLYRLKGENAKAESDFKQVVRLDSIPEEAECSFYAYYYLGQKDKAIEILNTILDKDKKGNCYDAACLYSVMGEKEKALSYLRQSLEDGYRRFAHIKRDRDLNNIRNTEEFKVLLKEYEEKHLQEIAADADGDDSAYELKVEEISFTQESGVCKVKCAINGLPLHFIFDTGATDVSISSVEATFMAKNDFLSSSDIIGKQNYQTADGNITEGTVINLKDVKLGSLHLNNIKASVVRNQAAPLLLGQSVLSKLGKIEIDNTKKVLRITHKQKIN